METDLPDLLLLDIWMSGTDGLDICKQLKQNTATQHIPIVLLSASREIEKSALDAGANDFLSKPFLKWMISFKKWRGIFTDSFFGCSFLELIHPEAILLKWIHSHIIPDK